jgi:DNA-binding IclR family transcriptional regulator
LPALARNHRPIKAVEHALTILNLVRENPPGQTVKALAETLQLTPASVYQLARTIESFGYLVQDSGSKRFLLGPAAGQLAAAVNDELRVVVLSSPDLYQLHARYREDVHLSNWRESSIHDLLYLKSTQNTILNPTREMTNPGDYLVHCTATGKVYLSHLPEAEVLALAPKGGFPRYTERTIHTTDALFAELRRVRSQGYAVSDEEHYQGKYALAAPIYDNRGQLAAAVAIGLPVERSRGERRSQMLADLLETARSISHRLGCPQ